MLRTAIPVTERLETFRAMLDHACATRGAALMGICNITPDSFSDGGRYLQLGDAKRRLEELVGEGADLVDIGGESTRPGARPVSDEEQLARVLEPVRFAVSLKACVSIDTTSPTVAEACLAAGACAVNDVSCLREPDLAGVVHKHGAALLLMHARGPQEKMRGFSQYPDAGYGDVVTDVVAEWKAAAARARSAGVPPEALVMDPGLGFAKNARQSGDLLARLAEIVRAVEVPVLVGPSRKSFLATVDVDAAPAQRLGASIAAALHAWREGATILRVHDVRATRQALDVARRLEQKTLGGG